MGSSKISISLYALPIKASIKSSSNPLSSRLSNKTTSASKDYYLTRN